MKRIVDIDAMFSSFAPCELFDKSEIEEYCEKYPLDAEPVRHGKWSSTEVISRRAGYSAILYHHEECKVNPLRLFESMMDYCPCCGAKMYEK